VLHRDGVGAVDVVRALVVLLGSIALVTGAASLQPTATAQSAPALVIDRTFVCVPGLVGGIRKFEARAHRGTGLRGARWDRPAFVALSTTGAGGSAATAIQSEMAWMTAGRPLPSSTVIDARVPGYEFPIAVWGTLAVNNRVCNASSKRVALGTRRLVSQDVGSFDDRYDCTNPRVFVHVRATLASRSSLRSFGGFLRTTVPVRRAELMIRTASGRPLVYAQVLESGKSSLFTAPSCFPD
jgi:hypothetical protein